MGKNCRNPQEGFSQKPLQRVFDQIIKRSFAIRAVLMSLVVMFSVVHFVFVQFGSMNPFWHSFALYTICTIEFGAASLVNSFCSRFIWFLDLVALMYCFTFRALFSAPVIYIF